MKKHEMVTLLKESGFYFLKSNKHEIWTDGITRITLNHCNKIEDRLSKMIKLQIKKAVALRQSQQKAVA